MYYDDGSGNPEGSPALSVPENFGQYTSTDDPVLIQHRVLDANGNPVDDKTVTVHIVPADTDSWPTAEPYPVVTTGSTDVAGYVQATLANGLDAYQDNPAFENETTGQITLAVNYTNANDDDIQAFTATEDLAPYYDPVLQQHTVKDGSGSVLPNASLVVNVEPRYRRLLAPGLHVPSGGHVLDRCRRPSSMQARSRWRAGQQ